MKIYLTILLTSFVFIASAQSWQWVRNFGGDQSEDVCKSKTDSKGNSVLAGWFMSNSVSFGNTTHDLTSLGYDAYVTKIDSTGTVLWSKKPICNGGAGAFVFGVTVDDNDNIIVCGTSDATSIDFGNGVVWLNDAPSISNLFIVKYDENGTALWVYNTFISEASGIQPTGICSDNNNNIYCVGIFSTINYVGFSGPNSDTLESGFNSSSFLLKLNSNGSFNKVTHAFGDNSNSALNEQGPRNINYGKDGFLYIIGNFDDENDNSYDPYVRKVNTSLTTVWTKLYNTNLEGYFNDIEIDIYGNSFIVGEFNGSSLSFNTNSLTNPNTNDEHVRMITSLDNSGELRWQKLLSNTQSMAYGLTLSPNGTIYVGGTYRDTLFFGTPAPLTDIIVFSLNPTNGSINWELIAGAGFNSFAIKIIQDVICDNQGKVYVIGKHADTDFPFGNQSITTNGLNDVFIAKIGSTGTTSVDEKSNTYFDFYPNPLKDELFLASDNNYELSIKISDINGKVVYQKEKRFYQTNIDLSNLQSGMYLMNISNLNGTVYSGKLIKE